MAGAAAAAPFTGGLPALALVVFLLVGGFVEVHAGVVAVGKLQTCVNDGTVSVLRPRAHRSALIAVILLADARYKPQLLSEDSGDRGVGEQQALRN
jgi:hypothetical protein